MENTSSFVWQARYFFVPPLSPLPPTGHTSRHQHRSYSMKLSFTMRLNAFDPCCEWKMYSRDVCSQLGSRYRTWLLRPTVWDAVSVAYWRPACCRPIIKLIPLQKHSFLLCTAIYVCLTHMNVLVGRWGALMEKLSGLGPFAALVRHRQLARSLNYAISPQY